MDRHIFHTDSYKKEFDAVVLNVDDTHAGEHRVLLDQTAFYPGGGGQPHDVGSLEFGGTRTDVQKVQKVGEDVWHTVMGAVPAVGMRVTGRINWLRRYQLMRTHTAMHVLCGVVWRDYQAQVTGGNMEPLRGRLDFEFETLQQDLVGEIEGKINAEIKAAREVRTRVLPRDEAMQIPDLIRTKINLLPPSLTEIRIVEIVGLDIQADGGTHVANTSEVGRISILDYKSKGRINKRIRLGLEP